MANFADSKTVRGPFPWLLWWRIDERNLRKQMAGYKTLPFYQTMRGVSSLMFLASAVITVAVAVFSHKPLSLIDAGLFLILSVFIYLGHRWAMMAGMILWTIEKLVIVVSSIVAHNYAAPVSNVIWWAVYMHAIYFAYRIESERRKNPIINVSAFD